MIDSRPASGFDDVLTTRNVVLSSGDEDYVDAEAVVIDHQFSDDRSVDLDDMSLMTQQNLHPSTAIFGHRKTNSDASSMQDGSVSTHSRSSSPKGSTKSGSDRRSQSGTDNTSVSGMSRVASAGRSLKNLLSPSYRTRNDQYRKLFKNVPENDKFVIDYSCAFQREILVHGRMYLSQQHVCFYANIFKWETCLTIEFKEIKTITKERTAMVIPNAIQLTHNNGEKYFFTSYARRDKSFLMIFKLWQCALLDRVRHMFGLRRVHSIGTDLTWLVERSKRRERKSKMLASVRFDNRSTQESALIRSHSERRRASETSAAKSSKPVSPAEMWEWAKDGYRRGDDADLSHSDEEEIVDEQVSDISGQVFPDDISLGGSSGPLASSPTTASPSSGPTFLRNISEMSESTHSAPPPSPIGIEIEPGASKVTFVKGENAVKKKMKDKANKGLKSVHSSPALALDSTEPDELVSSDSSENENELHCPCTDHQGQELVNIVLPLSVDQLFIQIFTDTAFFREFEVSRKVTNIVLSKWEIKDDGSKERTFKYTMGLSGGLGPKSCDCCEKSTCFQYGKAGQIYVIRSEIENHNVPYADKFLVYVTVCLSRVATNQARIMVHGHVHFVKSVWGMIKNMIEKNTIAGLSEYYQALGAAVKEYCAKLGIPSEVPAGVEGPPSPGPERKKRRRKSEDVNGPATVSPVPSDASTGLLSVPKEIECMAKILISVMVVMLLLNGALFVKLWSLEKVPAPSPTLPFSLEDLKIFLQKSDLNVEDVLTLQRLHRQQAALDSVKTTLRTLNQIEAELKDLRLQFESVYTDLKLFEKPDCHKPLNDAPTHKDATTKVEL